MSYPVPVTGLVYIKLFFFYMKICCNIDFLDKVEDFGL